MTNQAKKPRVVVSGAFGKMGKAAVQTFCNNADKYELVAGIVRDKSAKDPKEIAELESQGVNLTENLTEVLNKGDIDILVELTTPDSVFKNSKLAMEAGTRTVIGATGLSEQDINELSKISQQNKLGTIIAPNFAIGAILMMKFAAEAAKHFEKYEIIELHHDKKVDAPSGTAIKTANLIKNHSGNSYEAPIHSVRLPGLVAHQQVIFGGTGQTLTIKHDSIDRSSFMPGILFACDKVMGLDKLVYGLENLV